MKHTVISQQHILILCLSILAELLFPNKIRGKKSKYASKIILD